MIKQGLIAICLMAATAAGAEERTLPGYLYDAYAKITLVELAASSCPDQIELQFAQMDELSVSALRRTHEETGISYADLGLALNEDSFGLELRTRLQDFATRQMPEGQDVTLCDAVVNEMQVDAELSQLVEVTNG